MTLGHDDLLAAVGIGLQHSLDGSVLVLALAPSQVPGVSDRQFEVVIIINGSGDVSVVHVELLSGHLSVSSHSVPLLHEVLKDLLL